MKNEITAKIKEEKIIAIIRHLGAKDAEALCGALYKGGIRLTEITFDPTGTIPAEETAKTISVLREKFAGKMLIGAGAVLDMDYARIAIGAGAEFIISPDTNPAVIARTRELELVSMPGAMTPSEILAAHAAGADLVKLFPAAARGPAYLKSVLSPISHVRIMAVGGSNEKNASQAPESKVLKVATDANFPPFEFYQEQS